MPTEARGNYLPEPPYLRETKTYHSQPLESIRHDGNYFVSLSIRPIFIFCYRSYVKLLDYWRAEKISRLPKAPPWGLRPVAFATSATWLIRHGANSARVTVCGLRTARMNFLLHDGREHTMQMTTPTMTISAAGIATPRISVSGRPLTTSTGSAQTQQTIALLDIVRSSAGHRYYSAASMR